MFWQSDPVEWMQLARVLQLAPYIPTAGFSFGESFRQLKRSLGMPASAEPSWKYWLFGQRRGLEVMVLGYTTGSGSSTTQWTGAVARIDPPVFLGLSVTLHTFLDGLFNDADINVGHPVADKKLRIEGFDPARISTLLSPHDRAGYDLLARMVALAGSFDVRVTDSLVAISLQGVHADPQKILAMLDPAIDLAASFAARRPVIPMTQAEIAQQAQWEQFADTNGWSFDAARMKLVGARAGTSMEFALETDGRRVSTAVTARFPHTIHVAFTAIPTQLPSFLQGIFSQDIEVGDPEFDRAFKVTGHPVEGVQAALARPGLLAVLKHLSSRTPELQMNQTQLFFRLPGSCPLASDVESFVELGRTVSRELFGEVKSMGPFR